MSRKRRAVDDTISHEERVHKKAKFETTITTSSHDIPGAWSREIPERGLYLDDSETLQEAFQRLLPQHDDVAEAVQYSWFSRLFRPVGDARQPSHPSPLLRDKLNKLEADHGGTPSSSKRRQFYLRLHSFAYQQGHKQMVEYVSDCFIAGWLERYHPVAEHQPEVYRDFKHPILMRRRRCGYCTPSTVAALPNCGRWW